MALGATGPAETVPAVARTQAVLVAIRAGESSESRTKWVLLAPFDFRRGKAGGRLCAWPGQPEMLRRFCEVWLQDPGAALTAASHKLALPRIAR